MQALLLSAGSSIHTARWVNGLSRAGVRIVLATQHPVRHVLDPKVDVFECPYRGSIGYPLMVPWLRRVARAIRPDILNAHFASGYGTTGALINQHPYLLSVWGSDVFSFPERSPFHRWLVRRNLLAADGVASTSRYMADQVRSIAPQIGEIAVTPFGVDIGMFVRVPDLEPVGTDRLVIGTVKSMEVTYGIDTLIEAFARLRERLVTGRHPLADRIALRLVGAGSQMSALQLLAARLGLVDVIEFVGHVPHSAVPGELAKLDIYVALSRRESFGVAVLEAGAAGRPVVVSDAGGLAEVVRDGITGIVVPRENPVAAAKALFTLVSDPEVRASMGQAARRHVRERYAWEQCVERMLALYENTVRTFSAGRAGS